MGNIITSIAFPCKLSSYNESLPLLYFVKRDESYMCSTMQQTIPTIYYHLGEKYPTLLMCHGNAEDIGEVDPIRLSNQFNANICLFDYAGYGLHSCKQASEKACFEDVLAVYDHLVKTKKIPKEKIFIYGRSIGTGVACYLAHYLCKQNIPNHLILVSPIMSAARVVTKFWIPGDIFMNYQLAPEITSSTLIIHGDYDTLVPYSCGQSLSKLFPNLYQFVVLEGVGHQNIGVSKFYNSINTFLIEKNNNIKHIKSQK